MFQVYVTSYTSFGSEFYNIERVYKGQTKIGPLWENTNMMYKFTLLLNTLKFGFICIIAKVYVVESRSQIPCDPNSPLAPGQTTNGGITPIPCYVCSWSPCVPVAGAGWALLGGIELKLNLNVLGIGVDRVEMLHPVRRRCGPRGNASLDRL